MVIQNFHFSAKTLFRLGLIVALSFVMGFFLPMLIAKHERVYFDQDLKNTFLHNRTKTLANQRKAFVEFDQRQVSLKQNVSVLETKVLKDTTNRKSNLELLDFLKKEVEVEKKPLSFRPLYNNHLMFFWVFVFISLSAIIFVVSEVKAKSVFERNKLKYLLSVFAFLYPIYRLPSWLRNLPEGQTDGKVIYFANLNFSPLSFLYQELEAFIVTALLSIIICQWIKLYEIKKQDFDDCEKDYFQRFFHFEYVNTITSTFFNWQVASICLLPTFVWYATYYWNNVILTHDTRYILPSIIVHSMLIAVWTVISLPTIITYFDFARCKLEAKKYIFQRNLTIDERRFWIQQIDDVKPISFWNFAISSASGIISILLPLLGILK